MESKKQSFEVGDMILYNFKFIGKVIMLHKEEGLLRIKIYHNTLTTTTTDVFISLCEKFEE